MHAAARSFRAAQLGRGERGSGVVPILLRPQTQLEVPSSRLLLRLLAVPLGRHLVVRLVPQLLVALEDLVERDLSNKHARST